VRKFAALSFVLGVTLILGACAGGNSTGETESSPSGTTGTESPAGSTGTDLSSPSGSDGLQSPSESPSEAQDSSSSGTSGDAKSTDKAKDAATLLMRNLPKKLRIQPRQVNLNPMLSPHPVKASKAKS
jgi:hypothetical protein